MGFLDMLTGGGKFAEYVEQAKKDGIALLDVREPDEFAEGHIEGAVNIPLGNIQAAEQHFPDKSTKIYVHCLSGGRSASAVESLESMGYADVTNIGGIGGYAGAMVAGK